MDYLEIILRSLLAIAVLLFLARIDGAKQVGQLSFYDYIVGITAGSIAATLCIDREINIWYCIIAIVLFMLSSFFLSFVTSKSMFLRRAITGSPIFLIAKGELMYDGLKRAHFDINDLLRELRSQGYFDISEVNYAVLEANGTLSVMPKAASRPANASESGLSLSEDELNVNVIIDGKIIKGNLSAANATAEKINTELAKQNIASVKDVALGTMDNNGTLTCYLKESAPTSRTVFE